MSEEELKLRTVWNLRKDIESLVFDLNTLYPDFLGMDEAKKELLEWSPQNFDFEYFKESPYYGKGDENAPFFSEAFLYNLLGKEDARTLLALLRGAFGIKGMRG